MGVIFYLFRFSVKFKKGFILKLMANKFKFVLKLLLHPMGAVGNLLLLIWLNSLKMHIFQVSNPSVSN